MTEGRRIENGRDEEEEEGRKRRKEEVRREGGREEKKERKESTISIMKLTLSHGSSGQVGWILDGRMDQ